MNIRRFLFALVFMAALLSGQEISLLKLPELPKDVVVADVAQGIKNKKELVIANLYSQGEKRFLLLILDNDFVAYQFYKQFFFASGLKSGLGIIAHGRANMMAHGQNIDEYLKGNRDSFHKLLGVTQIDFVGIAACNRGGDSNTGEMRGLGYMPDYRQAAFADTGSNDGVVKATLSIFLKEKKSMIVRHHTGSSEPFSKWAVAEPWT